LVVFVNDTVGAARRILELGIVALDARHPRPNTAQALWAD